MLSDSGSGTTSGIIAGINWVVSQAQTTKRPSIINLSIGGSASTTLDNAVNAAINSGVFVTVSAGNEATDAGNFSPARVAAALTVGASTITDAIASGSNYGTAIDLFAPGQTIPSCWIGGSQASNVLSGSSTVSQHELIMRV